MSDERKPPEWGLAEACAGFCTVVGMLVLIGGLAWAVISFKGLEGARTWGDFSWALALILPGLVVMVRGFVLVVVGQLICLLVAIERNTRNLTSWSRPDAPCVAEKSAPGPDWEDLREWRAEGELAGVSAEVREPDLQEE